MPGILTQGGTILGSDNKANPFDHIVGEGETSRRVDVSDQCMELYEDLGLDALICVGGDGTMTIAGKMAEKGARTSVFPKPSIRIWWKPRLLSALIRPG